MNNDERNALLERLFAAASRLPAAERAAFLDEACAGDDELRSEVESLLAHDLTNDRLLETAAANKLAGVLAAEDGALVGREFDGYFIVRELGRGGMGRVYLAEDLRLKRRLVAVKVLPELFAQNAAWVERFEREAQAASALNHPNIVTIHATGQSAGQPFIVMEYIAGVTLRERLQTGALAWPEAVRIATQMAGALHTAHQAGIIHRDIKPENVMLRADGLVKVLDFGIAKLNEERAQERLREGETEKGTVSQSLLLSVSPSLTLAGTVVGTPDYLSPEQARGETPTPQTDVFACGLVLYEMLAGHPYAALPVTARREAWQSAAEFPPLGARRPDLPMALVELVMLATRKAAAARQVTAAQLHSGLEELRTPLELRAVDGSQQLARQRANTLLNQAAALYANDAATRLSLTEWWMIQRRSNAPRGALERALIRKSLLDVLAKAGAVACLAALLALALAAFFSIEEQWQEKSVRDGHVGPAYQVIFSPDGRRLISVGQDKQVIVWDFARRERLATLTGHTREVRAAAFSPNSKWLVTGSDAEVIVWDAASLQQLNVLPQPRPYVACLTFTADSQRLAYFSGQPGYLTIRAVDDSSVLYDVPLDAAMGIVATTPDQRQLVNVDGQRWDLTGAAPAGQLRVAGAAAFSPAGTQLVVMLGGAEVVFYGLHSGADLTSKREVHRERAHGLYGRAAAYSPDGLYAATGADDIVLWEAATQKKLGRFAHSDNVWGLAFSPDSRWLVSSHGDGALLLWDVAARRLAASFNGHSGPVTDVAFSLDGQRLISASRGDCSVIVWEAQRLTKATVFPGKLQQIPETAFSPDRQWVATCETGRRVKLWQFAKPESQRAFQIDPDDGAYLLVAPGGKWVATNARAYDGVDGHVIGQVGWGRDFNIGGMGLSADGTRLATGVGDGRLLLWDTATWQPIAEARVPNARMMIRMAFSPDGQRLAVGDTKGEIWLWQVQPLRSLARLGQHKDNVQALAFSPDGRVVASGSDDQTLALWDVAGRRLITYVGTHAAPVLALAFSPSGQQLVTGGQDNSVRVYTRQRSLWGWRLD